MATPIDWRAIARREEEQAMRRSMEAALQPPVATPIVSEPEYTGPTLSQGPEPTKPNLPDYDALNSRDNYKKWVKKDGQWTTEEPTGIIDQLLGGILRPFEKAISGQDQDSNINSYQIPYEALTTPEKVSRGAGNVAGYVAEYLPFSKVFSGVGQTVLGGTAEQLTKKLGPRILAKELAGKELTKQVKKQAFKEVQKAVARRVAVQAGVGEALAGASLAGIESRGDPVSTGLGALLGFLTPVVGNELSPLAKQGFNRAVTLGRKALAKGAQVIDDVAGSHAVQTLKNERGSLDVRGTDPNPSNITTGNVADNLDNLDPTDIGGKERGFVTTVKEADKTAPELAQGVSGNYDPIVNTETLAYAKNIVDNNIDDAVKIAKSSEPATAESNAVALVLIDKYQKAGRFQDAIDLVEITAEKATKQGQAIQALSMYNRLSPEGILKYATKQLDKARNSLPKDTVEKVAQTADDLAKKMNDVNQGVANQVATQIDDIVKTAKTNTASVADDAVSTNNAAEMLAQRLAQSTEAGAVEKAGPDPVKDMVNTLHKYGKEFLEKQGKPVPRDPIEFVADVLKNRDQYQEVWTKAQDVIREKFKNQPELLKQLDDVLNVSGLTPFADNQMSQALKQALRESNVNLGDLVRQHYTITDSVKKQLSEKLVEKAGLAPDLAQELENFISNKFTEMAGQKKEQLLKQIFSQRFKKALTPVDQKILQLSNLGAFSKREYQQLVAKKLGLPSMDDELAQTLFEKAQAIQAMPEGREKVVATAEMMKIISDQVPVSLAKKVSSIQTMAQLLNPKSPIRNVVGNAGFQAAETVSDVVSIPIDKAVSLVTGQRTKVLPSLSTQFQGFKRGAKEGLEDAVKGIDTLPTVKTQFEIPRVGVFDNKVGKGLEKLLSVELKAPDRAFYQAAYDNSLNQQMRALAKSGTKVVKPTPEMIEIAHHDALYRTFQDDSAASVVFTGLKKALNAGKEFGLGDFILKYPKTPANILSRGLAYSPAGFVNTMYQAARPLMGKSFNQKAFVESFSRALVGSGSAVGMGALLHRIGIITGGASNDFEIASLERDAGLGSYKINVSALKRFVLSGFDADAAKLKTDDTLISYDWFQPLAIGISLGANLDQNKGKSGIGLASAVAEATKGGVDSIAELPLVTGVTRFLKKGSLAEGVAETAENAPSSFVPSILSQIRMMTDQPRETYDPDIVTRAKNKVFAKVPFLSKKLPPQIDVFGNERKFFQGENKSAAKKLFDVFINPAWVTKYKPTPEAELVLSLYRDTGEVKQSPRFVQKNQKYKGLEIELTTQQLQEMRKYVGAMTGERFRQLAGDEKFLKLSPEDKVDTLSKELTNIGKIAKLKILGPQFKELAKDDLTDELIKQDESNLQLNTQAEQIYERLKSMSKEDANAKARQIKEQNRLLFDKIKSIRADEKEGLSLEDRKIKALQVKNGYRANYIWKQVQQLSTREQKNAYIKELKDKGVITRNIMKQIVNLKNGKAYDYDE